MPIVHVVCRATTGSWLRSVVTSCRAPSPAHPVVPGRCAAASARSASVQSGRSSGATESVSTLGAALCFGPMATRSRGRTTRRLHAPSARAPVLSSKFALPAAPAAMMPRPRLTDLLGAADGAAVVSIVAPAGYGKTTLLRQWADHLPHVGVCRPRGSRQRPGRADLGDRDGPRPRGTARPRPAAAARLARTIARIDAAARARRGDLGAANADGPDAR